MLHKEARELWRRIEQGAAMQWRQLQTQSRERKVQQHLVLAAPSYMFNNTVDLIAELRTRKQKRIAAKIALMMESETMLQCKDAG